MSVLLAVLVVGAGSLAYRLVPFLGAAHLSPALTRLAGRVGLAVLAALIVRSVVDHHDASVPLAPVIAGASVGTGLLLAYRRRPVLLSVAAGVAAYVALSAAVAALT